MMSICVSYAPSELYLTVSVLELDVGSVVNQGHGKLVPVTI